MFFPLVSKSTNILIYNSWYLRIVVSYYFYSFDSLNVSIIFSRKRPFGCSHHANYSVYNETYHNESIRISQYATCRQTNVRYTCSCSLNYINIEEQ